MNTNLFNILLIAGAIQGFVFNIVTIFYKKKTSKAIIFLNLLVFFLSLNNLQAWLIDNEYSYPHFFVKNLLIPWYMLIFPMFYMFLVHYLKVVKQNRSLFKIIISLFFLEVIVRITLICHTYFIIGDMDNSFIRQYTHIEEFFNALLGLFIIIKAGILIFNVSKPTDYIQKYDDIRWLKIFIILGCFVFAFWIFAILVHLIIDNDFTYIPLRLGTSILLYWIAYQGFYRYQVTEDRISLRQYIKAPERNPSNLETITPEIDDLKKEFDDFKKIDAHLLSNQKFLNPNLSMELLAKELQMSAGHLSKVVNTHSNFNFSDYINFYRIEQAKKLLGDTTFDNYTNLSIGLECGFNSKSTFYAAFKKFTDQTPSQFKAGH